MTKPVMMSVKVYLVFLIFEIVINQDKIKICNVLWAVITKVSITVNVNFGAEGMSHAKMMVMTVLDWKIYLLMQQVKIVM